MLLIPASGANIYISIETPYEQELFEAKRTVALKVVDAENYMASAFWSYMKDLDVYNYSYYQ
jgi:hypothetical protein